MSRVTAALAKQINGLLVTGGKAVVANESILDSALDRADNLAHYEKDKNHQPPRLAAEIAWGVIQNHPFQDGNKRTAFILANEYLRLSGVKSFSKDDPTKLAGSVTSAIAAINKAHEDVATGKLTSEQLGKVYADALKKAK